MRYSFLAILGLGFLCGPLSAAELKSGLQPGEYIPAPFHYLNLNGGHAGNPHCLVCEYALLPVVAIFVHENPDTNSKVDEFLQKLDGVLGRHQAEQLRGFVVFLSADFAKEATRRELLSRIEPIAGKLKNVVVAVDGAAGPDKYNINPEAAITVILYQKHKVVANFAFPKDKMTDQDVSAILAAAEKMVPGRSKR